MGKRELSKEQVEMLLLKFDLEKTAREYIDSIRERMIRVNRFFTDEDFLSVLKETFEESQHVIEKGSAFYRARIYNASDKPHRIKGVFEENDFEGYKEKESFVNQSSEWPIFGRMHPSGVRVLYTASDEKTAAKELNPSVDELISIATIKNDAILL